MKTGSKSAKIAAMQAHEVKSATHASRRGQDNGKSRVSTGPQAATGGTQGNQLTHAKRELAAQHPASGRKVMRGDR